MVPIHVGTLHINQLLYHIYIIFFYLHVLVGTIRYLNLSTFNILQYQYLSLSTLIYMDERDKQLPGTSKTWSKNINMPHMYRYILYFDNKILNNIYFRININHKQAYLYKIKEKSLPELSFSRTY